MLFNNKTKNGFILLTLYVQYTYLQSVLKIKIVHHFIEQLN